MSPRTWRRLLTAARTAYGLVLVCRPDDSPELAGGGSSSEATRTVLRVLGGRHLVQAAATAAVGTPRALRVGAGVDVLHGVSALGLAVASDRARRASLVSAASSAVLALVGVRAARSG